MKCIKSIKSIKSNKNVELGEIIRVDDKTASNMVGNSWEYIPKSEWKEASRKPKSMKPERDETEEGYNKKEFKKKKNYDRKSK